MWHFSVVLFAFFLIETCRLGLATAGLLIASALSLNGVADLALGSPWQRSKTTTVEAAERF